jgi:hypothetical protein
MRFTFLGIVVLSLAAIALFLVPPQVQSADQAPAVKETAYGGVRDVTFASMIWPELARYGTWLMRSDYLPGKSPHGDFVRVYYNTVNLNGTPYHVLLKENFGGEGAALVTVAKEPAKYLKALTVMIQREAGYDPDNRNWFWVKYNPDGTVAADEKGLVLAGRIAKGQAVGCIACHANARGGDYIFTNDK